MVLCMYVMGLVKREACLLHVPHTHWTEGVRFSYFFFVYIYARTDRQRDRFSLWGGVLVNA